MFKTHMIKPVWITVTALMLVILLITLQTSNSYADNFVISIDPGHGGFDQGIISDRIKEKDLTLSISKELETSLRARGIEAFLTRSVDRHLSIADRADRVNRHASTHIVSIHMSHSPFFAIYVPWYPEKTEPIKNYFLMYSRQRPYLDKSISLAESLTASLKKGFNLEIRIRKMPLPLLNSIGAPAVMLEVPSFEYLDYGDQSVTSLLTSSIINGIIVNGTSE